MARIYGVNLPAEKRIDIALAYLYGIGFAKAKKILDISGVNPATRTKALTEQEIAALTAAVEKFGPVEGDLRRQVVANIKRKKDIESYQGIRHKKGLTVRGQRTRTNTRTVRGNVRRTMGSGRRGAAEKT